MRSTENTFKCELTVYNSKGRIWLPDMHCRHLPREPVKFTIEHENGSAEFMSPFRHTDGSMHILEEVCEELDISGGDTITLNVAERFILSHD